MIQVNVDDIVIVSSVAAAERAIAGLPANYETVTISPSDDREWYSRMIWFNANLQMKVDIDTYYIFDVGKDSDLFPSP